MTVAIRTVVLASVLALLAACGGSSQSTPNVIQGAGEYGGTSTNAYTLGGTVAGLSGNGLVLEMNDGSDQPVETNGAFAFPGSLASGTAYSISIKHQPAVRVRSAQLQTDQVWLGPMISVTSRSTARSQSGLSM